MTIRHLSHISWVLFAGSALQARAQTIDYASFEGLFAEPVTTSATGSPQRVSDVPVTMEVITAEQIRRSGAHDIPGILSHVVGVDVLQWTNDYADISVRGYNQAGSARLLVLIDGRQVYADYYGFTPWSALPVELSAIQQIEVMKGPNSALFGFNAVGGVINIITANPVYDEVNVVSAGIGTQGLVEGSAVGTLRSEGLGGLRVEFGGRSNHDFSTPVPEYVAVNRRGDYRAAADIEGALELGPHRQLSVEGSYSEANDTEISPVLAPVYAHYRTASVKGQALLDTSAGTVRATAYSNWIRADYLFGADIGPLSVRPIYDNQTVVAQLEDVAKPDARDTLRATVEYRYDTATTAPVTGGRISYNVIAISGMWDLQILPTVAFTNALRVDRLSLSREGSTPVGYPLVNSDWDRNLTEESFNTGLVWHVDAVDTVRLTLARGVELPNLVDLGAFVSNSYPGNFTGVPTVQPTIVNNYEIGWDRALASLAATVHERLYYQTTRDIPAILGDLLFTAEEPYVVSANIGDSRAIGAELSIDGRIAPSWRWGAGYAFESIRDHFVSPLIPGLIQTDFEHAAPRSVITANLGWSRGPWELDGFLRYQSASGGLMPEALTVPTPFVSIPAHVTFDCRLGFKVTGRLTISLNGQNLFPRYQRQTPGPAVERRVIGTLSLRL